MNKRQKKKVHKRTQKEIIVPEQQLAQSVEALGTHSTPKFKCGTFHVLVLLTILLLTFDVHRTSILNSREEKTINELENSTVLDLHESTTSALNSLATRILTSNTRDFSSLKDNFPLSKHTLQFRDKNTNRLSLVTSKVEQEWLQKAFPSTYDSSCGTKPGPMSDTNTDNIEKQIGVTKVYRYPSLLNDNTSYAMYTTYINCDSLSIEDEQQYNNFQLKDWYTTKEEKPSQPADTQTADPLSYTYEQIREHYTPEQQGIQPQKIRLSKAEKHIFILYEYTPLVEQINIVALLYTSQGIKASQGQISYPTSGEISLSAYGNVEVLNAEGTQETIPSLIESWEEVGGGNPISISKDRTTLYITPEVKTIYLHLLDKDLYNTTPVKPPKETQEVPPNELDNPKDLVDTPSTEETQQADETLTDD